MDVLVARTERDLLTVAGPEAVDWLQGQLSQDVTGLAVGASASTFVLSPQGKVAGWGRLTRTADDAVEIDVDPGAGDRWCQRLERFKLRTKADIDLRTGVPMLAVRGREPAGSRPSGWPDGPGGDLLDPTDEDRAAVGAEGGPEAEADADTYEAARIRAGVPRWGAELDDDTIPATVGQWVIDASVSFTKGCYTGQELVARIDSRGGNVPRHLVGLIVAGEPPAAGTPIVVDGAEVGSVTSAASDGGGDSVAMGFVARGVTEPGDGRVGGTPVAIRRLPMAPA